MTWRALTLSAARIKVTIKRKKGPVKNDPTLLLPTTLSYWGFSIFTDFIQCPIDPGVIHCPLLWIYVSGWTFKVLTLRMHIVATIAAAIRRIRTDTLSVPKIQDAPMEIQSTTNAVILVLGVIPR